MTRLTYGVAASIALMVTGCTGMAQTPSSSMQGVVRHDVLRHEHGLRQGRRFRRARGRRQALPDARRRRRRGQSYVARVPQHAGPGAVNARDRIGKGPWRNAKGVVVANRRRRTARRRTT